MEDGEQRVLPCDPCEEGLGEKEQKDAELDKKIKALKKKNEALMQRHREIEEDRLRAEKNGMAVTSRRLKQDSLTITITKTPNEKRIVRKGRRSSDSTEQNFTLLMGNEMQLSVSMDNKVEGRATNSKKIEQDVLFLASKNSKDILRVGRGPHMQIAISRQKEFAMPNIERRREKTKKMSKTEQSKEPSDKSAMSGSDDPVTTPAVGQSEYLQWKKEREKVDTERLARQKNSKGEWRRSWDNGKKEGMSVSDTCYIDTAPSAVCGRRGDWGRKMDCSENKTKNKGVGKQNCNEKTSKIMNTMSSKAKGKDRLTGRAQRWCSIEHEEASYLPEDFAVQKSLEDKVPVKHPEGNFREDEFLNSEKLNVPVRSNSLGHEEKIVFANEKMLPECKQDVPFHGKKMEVRSDDVLSEGRETIEYLSVRSCDSEPSQNSAHLQQLSS